MSDSFALRSGFPWWLPLLTAAIAALLAVIVSQSTASAWDADVHLWSSDGRPATEYAQLLLEPTLQESAATGLMASERGSPAINDVSVVVDDTLIRLTVRASYASDAELLALSLARAAIDESHLRFEGDSGLDLLGLVQPGARKVAPLTERSAAWASALGLAAGLALAWTVAARSQRSAAPSTALGKLGRLGLRPLALLNGEMDHAPALTATIQPRNGVIALTSVEPLAHVQKQIMSSASRLAQAEQLVLWLDARRPAFVLPYETPPDYLRGTAWSPVTRIDLIRRAAAQAAHSATATTASTGSGCVLLLLDPLTDPDTAAIAQSADHVILFASAELDDDVLLEARHRLSGAPLLGVVLTDAAQADQLDFELAQLPE